MQRMFEDNEWRKQLQQNAREMIVSRYEQKQVWEALLSEYKTLEKEINAQKNT